MSAVSSFKKKLELRQPKIMGVINVTPDSFYPDSRFNSTDNILSVVESMLEAGADIIDIGAESTRPYAKQVSLDEELDRAIPAIEAIAHNFAAYISIDTSKPEVMQAAIAAGARMINDVRAFKAEGALGVAAKYQVPICVMHMEGSPSMMQLNPKYGNVVSEVKSFFSERIAACLSSGIEKESIILDPGIGFGKTLAHNLELIKNLGSFKSLGCPIMIGCSRKSMIGNILGNSVDSRLHGSLAAAVMALNNGADIIRVHDVAATYEAIKVANAIMEADSTMCC